MFRRIQASTVTTETVSVQTDIEDDSPLKDSIDVIDNSNSTEILSSNYISNIRSDNVGIRENDFLESNVPKISESNEHVEDITLVSL